MTVLSITFHAIDQVLNKWEVYVGETLTQMAENLLDAEHYILSEVQTEMVNEGKNYNLLLVFDNEELRQQFIESELVNIQERIASQFGESVMIFETFLNPIKARI